MSDFVRRLTGIVLALALTVLHARAEAQTVGNYFVFASPQMPQIVTYDDPPVFLLPPGHVVVSGFFRSFPLSATSGPIAPAPAGNRIRFTVDEVPVSDWLSGCGGKSASPCSAAIDLTGIGQGVHWLSIQQQGPAVSAEGLPFHVGPPVAGPQVLRYGSVLYDMVYTSGAGYKGGLEATYPGREPNRPGFPYGPRPAVPWSTDLPPSQIWGQRMTTDPGLLAFARRYSLENDGRVTIRNNGLTYYYIFNDLTEPLSGGPRNVAALALITDMGVWTENEAVFGVSAPGFLWRITSAGDVDILAGWRPQGQTDRAASPGHPHHADTWQIGSTQPAHGSSNHRREFFGVWVDGSPDQRFSEPWGMVRDVADDDNPSRIALGGQHRWYVADTRNGRIVHVDHYPVHSTPPRPPELRTVAGSPAGTQGCIDGIGPAARLGAPWNIKFSVMTRKYYFTDYLCHSIRSFDPESGEVRTVVRSAVLPPWPHGVYDIFYGTVLRAGAKPAQYHADGPPGVARILNPQGADFDSTGQFLIFGQRPRGVPAVREVNILTGEVTTLALMPGGTGTRDMHISVNKDASVGPLDDILMGDWKSSRRFSRTGTDKGEIFDSKVRRVHDGPADSHIATGGIGPVASGGGAIWLVNAGREGLYRFTRRHVDDPMFNLSKFLNGRQQYVVKIGMTYGVLGQDQLGGPTLDELSHALDDEQLLDRLKADNPDVASLSPGQADEVLCFVRWMAMAGSLARSYGWDSCEGASVGPSGEVIVASMVSPPERSTLAGRVVVSAQVSPGMTRAELWLDNTTLLATVDRPTAQTTTGEIWGFDWDTTRTWDGWHRISIKVIKTTSAGWAYRVTGWDVYTSN